MVTVEEATVGHAEGICRVCTAGWRDAYADVLPTEYVEANVRTMYEPERIADEIDDDRNDETGTWLVAFPDELGDRQADAPVVGAVRDVRPEPGVGEVSGLYVRPDRQGEGVGSRLLATLTDRQREREMTGQRKREATEQRVYVFADNDDAIGFYESKGFEADERLPAATVDGVDPDCEALKLSRSI